MRLSLMLPLLVMIKFKLVCGVRKEVDLKKLRDQYRKEVTRSCMTSPHGWHWPITCVQFTSEIRVFFVIG